MRNNSITKVEALVGWLTICVISVCISAAGKFVGCIVFGGKMKIGVLEIITDVLIGTVVYFIISKKRKEGES